MFSSGLLCLQWNRVHALVSGFFHRLFIVTKWWFCLDFVVKCSAPPPTPTHPESSVLPASPPHHHPLCPGKVGLSQESQVVPLTARDPGRKLGREGWGKQPETKAQGSARRLLPGGAHGPVPPGTQAQGQGWALTEASELSRG